MALGASLSFASARVGVLGGESARAVVRDIMASAPPSGMGGKAPVTTASAGLG
jgi:hypothetical protein